MKAQDLARRWKVAVFMGVLYLLAVGLPLGLNGPNVHVGMSRWLIALLAAIVTAPWVVAPALWIDTKRTAKSHEAQFVEEIEGVLDDLEESLQRAPGEW